MYATKLYPVAALPAVRRVNRPPAPRPASRRAVEALSLARVHEWANGPDPFARVISIQATGRVNGDGAPMVRVITSDGRAEELAAPLGSWLSDHWKGVLAGVVGVTLLPGLIGGAGGLFGGGAAAAAAGGTSIAGSIASSIGGLVTGLGGAVGTVVKTVATLPTTLIGGISSTLSNPATTQSIAQVAGRTVTQNALGSVFNPIDVAQAQGQITPQQAAELKARQQQEQAAAAQAQAQAAAQAQAQARAQAQAQAAAQERQQRQQAIYQAYQQYSQKLGEAQNNYQLALQYNQPQLAQQWAQYYNQLAQYLQQLQQAYQAA